MSFKIPILNEKLTTLEWRIEYAEAQVAKGGAFARTVPGFCWEIVLQTQVYVGKVPAALNSFLSS